MIETIADAARSSWPLVVVMACAVAVDRSRERRRRGALNRVLHELRRPLQALALQPGRDGQIDSALVALADLDAEVNGAPPRRRERMISGERLVADAAARWRSPATLAGRAVEAEWRAGRADVYVDPAVAARALDNLIANALEHGAERVRLVAGKRNGHLRITVANDVVAQPKGARRGAANGDDPRRGHGLAIVSGIAASAGGRFALTRDGETVAAVLELPIAAR